ncbi:MAG: hypothetical protein JSS32_07775 [Verrucomicrobia bacterium]|nr:hypothetical protein [Verrucomicrobiota bacterium]
MQASAPGAEEFQLPDVDLRNPLDHYRQLRTLWALSTKGDVRDEAVQKLLRHPIGATFQPSEAIAELLKPTSTLAPTQSDSGAALCEKGLSWPEGKLPLLPELCQLSLLWALNGKMEASKKLAQWLLPLLEFKTLWTSERSYDEREFYLSAYLLYSYAGVKEKASHCLSEAKISSQPVDPFFLVLEEKLAELKPFEERMDQNLDPELGLWTYSQGGLKGSIALSGWNTPLGSFKKGAVEIPALGPQGYPLTDSKSFGLSGFHAAQKLDWAGIRGWTQCLAQKDLWLEAAVEGGRIDVRFMGLSTEKKIAFVFYLKAEEAQIQETIFKPRSLERFNGLAKAIRFNKAFSIECPSPRKMELIPLAGEGCFWGANFLLAFEMNPFEPTVSFRLI